MYTSVRVRTRPFALRLRSFHPAVFGRSEGGVLVKVVAQYYPPRHVSWVVTRWMAAGGYFICVACAWQNGSHKASRGCWEVKNRCVRYSSCTWVAQYTVVTCSPNTV